MEILKIKKPKKRFIMIFAAVIFTALLTLSCTAYESGEELNALLSEIPADVLE